MSQPLTETFAVGEIAGLPAWSGQARGVRSLEEPSAPLRFHVEKGSAVYWFAVWVFRQGAS